MADSALSPLAEQEADELFWKELKGKVISSIITQDRAINGVFDSVNCRFFTDLYCLLLQHLLCPYTAR